MGHRSRVVLARLLLLPVLTLALLTALAPAASAHAYLETTNPGDGMTVQRSPRELRLSFSEHVVLQTTKVEVVDSQGRHFAVSDLHLTSERPDDISAPAVVVGTLPELPENAYRVQWATLSSDDLHSTSGMFVFGVGRPVAAARFTEPAPQVEETALRWLLLLGVALVLGEALVETRLPRDPALAPAVQRLRGLAWVGGLGALVTSVLLLVDQMGSGGLSLVHLVDSGYGARWAFRELGLLLLTGAALVRVRGALPRWRRPLLLAGTAATAAGTALLGHAAADGGWAHSRVLVTAAHVVAVTTWAGALVCFTVLVLPRGRGGRSPDLALRVALRAFAVPAAVCLAVAVVTGVWLASGTVVSLDAVVATTYGRALVLKVLLVAVVALLALVNHRRLRGRGDLDLPRRGVGLEAGAIVLVLAVTGVLSSAQPATQPRFLAPPSATRGPVSGRVADLQQTVDVRPNLPGPNVVSIGLFDTRRPSPGPVTAVRVTLPGQDPVAAAPLGGGRWSADLPELDAGTTSVVVTVVRDGLPTTSSRVPWVVATGVPHRVAVSDTPVRGPLQLLAALLAVLAVASGVLATRRRRAARSAAVEVSASRSTPGAPDGRRPRLPAGRS